MRQLPQVPEFDGEDTREPATLGGEVELLELRELTEFRRYLAG
ncbi:MAG: hypothetical protein OXC94_11800 [Chloroflexi bacterium]|nr:hypothetical protein [Chloroflexota bacterium]